jgi:hypothetical protein
MSEYLRKRISPEKTRKHPRASSVPNLPAAHSIPAAMPTSGDRRSALFGCDRLPKLDAVSFRVGDPAEPSEVIAFAFWVDRDAFVCQTVQHSIQVVHLEVDHCFLCQREVCIVLLENGEDDLGVLRRGRKRE